MQPAPVPRNEQERLQVLRRMGMLDTSADPELEQLVHHAACEVLVPMSGLCEVLRRHNA